MSFFARLSRDHAGIRPLSQKERIYGFFDLFWNWFGDSANASSWYFGGLLAMAGLPVLFWNTFFWSPLIILPWALLALISVRTGATTVLLSLPALGVRGGTLFLGVAETLVQVGWTTVTTYIGATSLVRLWQGQSPSGALVGHTSPLVVAILSMAFIQGATAFLGAGAIRTLKWISSLLLILLGGVETWHVFSHWKIREILAFHAGDPPLGAIRLFDISVTNIWTWLQVGDFARFSKTERGALTGSFLGLWIGQAWFVLVGAAAVIGLGLASGHLDPNDSDPGALMNRMGLSWIALSVIFLSCISVSSSNLYGAGIGLLALFSEKPRREGPGLALFLVSALSVLAAFLPLLFGHFIDFFTRFLTTIGGLFVPLWSLVLADYLVVRRRRIVGSALFDQSPASRYWGRNGFNYCGLVALAVGSVFYYAWPEISPKGLELIGVSLPSILVTGTVYIVLSGTVSKKKRGEGEEKGERID